MQSMTPCRSCLRALRGRAALTGTTAVSAGKHPTGECSAATGTAACLSGGALTRGLCSSDRCRRLCRRRCCIGATEGHVSPQPLQLLPEALNKVWRQQRSPCLPGLCRHISWQALQGKDGALLSLGHGRLHSTKKCFCRQSSATGQLVTAGTNCAKTLAAERPEHVPSLLQKAFWVAGGAQCP